MHPPAAQVLDSAHGILDSLGPLHLHAPGARREVGDPDRDICRREEAIN